MRGVKRSGLTLLGTVLLAAGCTHGAGVTPLTPSSSTASSSSTTHAHTTTTTPLEPPEPTAGASYDAVTQWISKGAPIDAAGFHTATRSGAVTDLGDYVAFTTPSGKTRCMTSSYRPGTLSCMVTLTNPPQPPADAVGNWVPGWVDFGPSNVTVGGLHGDPGPFLAGDGKTLDYGGRLDFGEFACRSETSGLFCANNKSKTAIRVSDAGIEPFGCLKEVAPDEATGKQFSC